MARKIKIGYASHGPQIDVLLPELAAALRDIRPQRGQVPFYSTVAGEPVDGLELCASYWERNERAPMALSSVLERLIAEGHDSFVELGPHPLLLHAVEQCLTHHRSGPGRSALLLPTMRRDETEPLALFDSLGLLYQHGHSLTWQRLYSDEAPAALRARLGLPAAAPADAELLKIWSLPLSAHGENPLRELCRAMAALLRDRDRGSLADIVYTASVRRSHQDCRVAVAGATAEELARALESFGRGETAPGLVSGRISAQGAPNVVFVFPGQGSQWWGMGRQLLATEPVFRAKLEECAIALSRHLGVSLLAELAAPESVSRLAETEIAQPALFAIEVAVASLLASWGVQPDAVIGHSVGELAALHISGALSLEAAARLVCIRGRLMQRATGNGKMVSVELTEEATLHMLAERAELAERVGVAAVNSPTSVVLSGETAALSELVERLIERGIDCRWLPVNYAFHSPQMEALRTELVAALGTVELTAGAHLPLYSTVTGTGIAGAALAEEIDVHYWGRNLRQSVRFAAAVASAFADGHRVFVEVGPHPVLSGSLQACLAALGGSGHVLSTLRRNRDERRCLLEALGGLYVCGAAVSWSQLYCDAGQVTSLPAYPWQRQRYWIDAPRAESLDPRFLMHKWRPAPAQAGRAAVGPRRFLLLADRGGAAEALRARLEERGASATLLYADEGASESPELFNRWIGGSPLAAIVHMWSLDNPSPEQTSVPTLKQAWRRDCGSALHLVQALAKAGLRDAPRLFLVTRGSHAVDSADAVALPTGALLWGLSRTIANEHHELLCTRVDLEAQAQADEASQLATELLSDSQEEEVALRARGRFVGRLVHPASGLTTDGSRASVRPDASYLLTGGLGGLGLAVAEWLVKQGARHLVLIGRQGMATAQQQSAVSALRQTGAQITVAKADVANRAELAAVLADLARHQPELRGVFHMAGQVDIGLLVQQSLERFEQVVAPKVAGAWNLHELTCRQELDFFIMYSSAAALLGSPGQASYAAGNSFLDALAHYRRARQLPALSINWGAFGGVGMGADKGRQARLVREGFSLLSIQEGNELLEKMLRSAEPQIGVVPLNLRQWVEFYPSTAASCFLSEIVKDTQPGSGTAATTAADRALQERIRSAALDEKRALIERLLREQLGEVLRLETEQCDPDLPFKRLGLDSLTALELRNRLEVKLGIKLSVTLLWTYSQVATLARHLSTQPGLTVEVPQAAAPAALRQESKMSATTVEAMSDEELVRRLSRKLSKK